MNGSHAFLCGGSGIAVYNITSRSQIIFTILRSLGCSRDQIAVLSALDSAIFYRVLNGTFLYLYDYRLNNIFYAYYTSFVPFQQDLRVLMATLNSTSNQNSTVSAQTNQSRNGNVSAARQNSSSSSPSPANTTSNASTPTVANRTIATTPPNAAITQDNVSNISVTPNISSPSVAPPPSSLPIPAPTNNLQNAVQINQTVQQA